RAVIEPQTLLATGDLLHALPQPGLDGMRVVEVRRPQQQPVAFQSPCQVFLGERRALIRQPGLIADQDDLAGEAFTPQRIDGLDGSLAAAHDDDPLVHLWSLAY